MSIENITLREIKQLSNLLNINSNNTTLTSGLVGEKVIIRTYSAGVHFGELIEKSGKEVILKNARRLYYWKTNNKGISLSEVASSGLDSESKVCATVEKIWLEAIEVIPCTNKAITSIEAQNEYKAITSIEAQNEYKAITSIEAQNEYKA